MSVEPAVHIAVVEERVEGIVAEFVVDTVVELAAGLRSFDCLLDILV